MVRADAGNPSQHENNLPNRQKSVGGRLGTTMIRGVHHINFIVRDLNEAVDRYQRLLSGHKFIFDVLESRAVCTARTKLGDTWLILVQSVGDQGVAANHLDQHGEGFFLMSLLTDNLDNECLDLIQKSVQPKGAARQGLDDWSVQDLDPNDFFGAQLQITEER